jgi:serine phosphatase RsbU (regulator of sigma subunit)
MWHRLLENLQPIPPEYKYLTSTFAVETRYTLLRIIRVLGLTLTVSVLLITVHGYVVYKAPMTGGLWFGSALLLVGFFFIGVGYRPPRRFSLTALVFSGLIILLLLTAGVALLTGNFLGLLLLTLILTSITPLFPWLIGWHLSLQFFALALVGTSYIFAWQQATLTPTENFLTLLLVPLSFLSIYLQALFINQRWKSFLSRHQNFLLNAELQTTNMQLEALNERLQRELALAQDIQLSLLPSPFPEWPGFDIVCYNKPARELGGDFYSHHAFGEGRYSLAVGDVSGKGVSAALLMAATLSLFDAMVSPTLPPAEFLLQLDEALTPYTQSHQQNCALCYLELDQRKLTVACAAGIPPYIRCADGQLKELAVRGLPLGQALGWQLGYEAVTFSLTPGDFVVLVSDGVLEALNDENEFFGFERLEQSLVANTPTTAQDLLEYILADLTRFTQGAELADDLTIVIFCLNP